MRSEQVFLVKVLLCLFICVCNGAPPKEADDDNRQRVAFTQQEDQLIVDELSEIYDGTLSLETKSLWTKIAEKFNEKWKQGVPGFPKERNARSLQSRLNRVLIFNAPENTVKVPEYLMQKSTEHRNAGGDFRHPYTEEENEFILDELLKPSHKHLFAKSTIESVVTEHAKKRKAGIHGFEHARYVPNIRMHLSDMKKKGLIRADVVEKFQKSQKVSGASASSSTTKSKQTESQVTNKQDDDDQWVAGVIHEFEKKTK